MNTKSAGIILFIVGLYFMTPQITEAMDRLITVDGEGGGQYTHIQDAVNHAGEGDTILVYPYTYIENISIKHRDLTVLSDGGPGLTTIDGGNGLSAVSIVKKKGHGRGRYDETDEVILEGFTITNGIAEAGGGVYIGDNTTSRIKNNIITGNFAFNWGGGIFIDHTSNTELTGNVFEENISVDGAGIACYQSSPPINDNTIKGNMSLNRGGGIFCFEIYAEPPIVGNVIKDNVADYGGGIGIFDKCSPAVEGNKITNNFAMFHGGGMYIYYRSRPFIVNNFFTSNFAGNLGGGIVLNNECHADIYFNTFFKNESQLIGGSIVVLESSNPKIGNNIIAGSRIGGGIFTDENYSNPELFFNDFWNNYPYNYLGATIPGTDDYYEDPLFENSFGDDPDVHISGGSPCINRALELGIVLDFDNEVRGYRGGADTGADERYGVFHLKVPENFETIQEAVDSAWAGDYVVVSPGTYFENVDLRHKEVVLTSVTGSPLWTVINGGGEGSVITAGSDGCGNSVIRGFTITGGNADCGGGIFIDGASPKISRNIFLANNARVEGGAIYCKGGDLEIRNNNFIRNTSLSGGAVYSESCTGVICNNIIAFNTASDTLGGGITGFESDPWISFNSFWQNAGGDITCLKEGRLNLYIEPMMADTLTGNYYLDPRSPCINGGDPDDFIPEGGGERIDIGAFEYELPDYPRVSFEFDDIPDTVVIGDSVLVDYTLTNHTMEGLYTRASIEVDGSDGRWIFAGNIYLAAGKVYEGTTTLEATNDDFPGGRKGPHNVYGRVGITPWDLYDITGGIVEVTR